MAAATKAASPARQTEADRVELVYYWALGQVANQTIIESRALFEEVPTTGGATSTWLKAAVALVKQRRSTLTRLAVAYYRLNRALRTGTTITAPDFIKGEDVGGYADLEDLRDQFDAVVDDIDADTASLPPVEDEPTNSPSDSSQAADGDPVQPDGPALDTERPDYEDSDYDDSDDILLEEIQELEDLIAQQDADAEKETQDLLDALGAENLRKKSDEIKTDGREAKDVDDERAKVHDLVGKRQSATASRIAMNAARGLAYSLAEHDNRIIGWVRYSPSGHPCGFCAMLISRALVYKDGKVTGQGVLYATRDNAGSSRNSGGEPVADSDRYHDNCRCVAVPIFFPEQLDSELFAQNADYARLWAEQVGGSKWTSLKQSEDDDQLSVWRRVIRERNREDVSTTPPAAQAAA